MIGKCIRIIKRENFNSIWNYNSCLVAVNYLVYDKKRHRIVKKGTSKVCGINNHKYTIHAEELALKFCSKNDKKTNRFIIIIWRYNKKKEIKPIHSCINCTKLVKKLNYSNKIFTLDNSKLISALIKNPKYSLGNIIRQKQRQLKK